MSNLFSKQSPWSHLVAAGAFALLFTACGDEVTEVTEVVGMQVVEAGDALPKCSADNEGAMVYSVDSAAAYTCIGKKWTSMKGKDGVDGKDGKDGADGKNGKDGKNGTNGKDGAKGDPGVKGDSGATGNNGLSAYEIAKAGGYTGTEEEWITSLKGDPGVKGDTGVAGTSCSAEEDSVGVKITCTDGKSFTLSNGADGKDYNGTEGVLIDPRDKQIYRVVTIGEQIWMAENLNYVTAEGSSCYGETDSDPKTENCTQYGRLYTWAAAIDVCPPGWHLPDTTEWSKLFTAVGGISIAGKKLKSQTGWSGGGNGTDAYGFSALPAGYRPVGGGFINVDTDADIWSATESNSSNAYSLYLYSNYERAELNDHGKNCSFSVRCLKD